MAHVDYRFDAAVLVPFLLAGLAAGLRTVGVVTTCQRINDADWKRPDLRSIRGGVLADGVGCAIGGCLGVVGMGSAPSLVGVSQASGATSRYIAFAALLLCLILASSPKLAAVFLALPRSVVGAGLVFTASFMIAGGLQIIAAHELDTRKTCIIGVSLLLGLSRVIFPDYYAVLPAALRALTGSLLTLSMVTAILLNLVFRIGLRRTAQLSVEVGEQTTARVESLATSIRDVAKSWKIEADVVERAAAAGARAVRLIHDNGLADGAITARLSFDDLTFEVQLLYQGDLLQIPRQRPLSDERLLEEQPFVAGLSGFMGGVYADRVTAASSDGSCQLRLMFEA